MLTYSLNKNSSTSMYEYLYRCIKNDIVTCKIQQHSKLPSKRSLAKNLGISIITVENAYAQLMVEGYIYSKPKIGYFAAPMLPQKLIDKKTHPKTALLPQITKTSYLADFSSNNVPVETFPYNTWAKLLRNTLTSVDEHSLLTDTSAGGVYPLKQAIANHLYQFRGLNIDPQQIVIGAGTQSLYNLIVQLLGRNHIYALEDPCYPQLAQIYRHNGVFCKYLPMDEQGIRNDILESSGADILHITPSHQFPTGIVMPIHRRYELLQWAKKKDNRYIIEDDYDCEFRLSGKPIPPLQSIDTCEKVIYINTFSKTLAPTFRISYMVLPPHLTSLFYQKLGFYSCTVSNFEQFTLAKFIKEGYLERHINKMRTYYKNKRSKVIQFLMQNPLNSHLKITGANSGLHFLLHIDTKATDSQILQSMQKEKITGHFLSSYYQQQLNDTSHTLLINYAGIPEKNLSTALEKLSSILKNYI